tara:strand:+ start:8758 stop:9267 length:510 start_codon:yes stop_codon:yes gene_type:complete
VNNIFTIEDCTNVLEWDYLGYKLHNEQLGQDVYWPSNWSNTIITKINMMSAMISQVTLRGGADTIWVHPKNAKLITSFEYYYDKTIGGRYEVIITKRIESNQLFVGRKEYFNLTHVSKFLSESEPNDPICVPIEKVYKTPDEVEEYKGKLVGCIKLLNYDKSQNVRGTD